MQPKGSRLKDSIALVTGGGRGIGKAISLALAREGATVEVGWVQNEVAATAVVQEIVEQGGAAASLKLDVRSEASVDEAVADIQTRHGRLDILVNNAGINNPDDFDQVGMEEWDEIMAVNLRGPFLVTQRAIPLLRKSQAGSVVCIGSVSGQYGGPRTPHYAASKAGLMSMTQVAARFCGKWGVRCNTVAAGLIASDMADAGLASPVVQKAAESIILGRLGATQEVAAAVVFLASPEASYITAQTLNVNGGLYF